MAHPRKKDKAVKKIISLMDKYEISIDDIIDYCCREIKRQGGIKGGSDD